MDLDSLTVVLRSFWTVWLTLVFTGIIAYAMWPSNRGKFDDASRIPLKEDGQEF